MREWAEAQRNADAPGFSSAGEAGGADLDEEHADFDALPSAESLNTDQTRALKIYTWGKDLTSWTAVKAKGAQRNFVSEQPRSHQTTPYSCDVHHRRLGIIITKTVEPSSLRLLNLHHGTAQNAAVLNGRGGGVDLRKNNGLSEGVQRNLVRCPR